MCSAILPNFAALSWQGGLALTTDEIAIPTSFAGLGLVTFALLLYPRIQKRIGCLACAKIGLALAIPLALFIATPSLFVPRRVRSMLWVYDQAAAGLRLANHSFQRPPNAKICPDAVMCQLLLPVRDAPSPQ